MSVVGIGGSVRTPSRTAALVAAIVHAVATRADCETTCFELASEGRAILGALTRTELGERGRGVLAAIEAADLLVVGTPVYRLSYTGALKHLFDLVDNQVMAGKVALLAATAGSPLHGLVTEHALRPLVSYFGILAAPTSVCAVETDFSGATIINPTIDARVARMADEAVRLLGAGAISRVAPLANIA